MSLIEDEVVHALRAGMGRDRAVIPRAVCDRCLDLLAVDGVAVALIGTDRRETLCASDPAVGTMEEWQFTFEQGPCLSAFRSGVPVTGGTGDDSPWPLLAGKARPAGFARIGGAPLAVGNTTWGALDMYSERAHGLGAETIADGAIVARALARLLTVRLAAAPAADDLGTGRDEVPQASGMVSVQRQVPIDEAFDVLRARALAEDRTLLEVARDVVAGRLRLDT